MGAFTMSQACVILPGYSGGRHYRYYYYFYYYFLLLLEKEMATHSSVLAWRIPGMGEPGGLQSTGSQRVGTRLK